MRSLIVFLMFLGALVAIAGCADRDSSNNDERRGGFYGGVSGGMSHP
jgi:hypothetical protein